MNRTEILKVGDKEYVCELTNDLKVGDLFIKTCDPIDRPIEVSLNRVRYSNQTSNMFMYEPIAGVYNYNYGWDTYRNNTDFSKLIGKTFIIETKTLFSKVLGEKIDVAYIPVKI